MDIYINDQPFAVDDEEDEDRAALWERLEEFVDRQGKVILDVLSDGESISEQDFLTVPWDIRLEVQALFPYEVGLTVLDEIRTDSDRLREYFISGALDVEEVSRLFEQFGLWIQHMRSCFPEWLYADRLGELIDSIQCEIKKLGCCTDQADRFESIFVEWQDQLDQGREELEYYLKAEQEDDTR